MFDIKQTTNDLNAISRKDLFAQLLDMPISELKSLKKEVRAVQKTARLIKDESFKPNGSTHVSLVAMVDNAITQKSGWRFLNNASFPVKKIVFWVFGLTLKKHPYLGTCRKYRDRKFLKRIKRFWSSHWKWLIGLTVPSILTMIGLYLAWLLLIKTKP